LLNLSTLYSRGPGLRSSSTVFSFVGNGRHSTEQFANVLDEALRHINSDYDAKRHKNIALRRLVLHAVPAGTFAAWLRSKGKLGGQHKVPRLSNERGLLEEILSFAQQSI